MPDDSTTLVRIALARDSAIASGWVAALEHAGIEAHAEIEDGAAFSSLGSVYGGQSFVYPVLVEAHRRDDAARVLVDLGARGPFYRRGVDISRVAGAVIVAALAVLLAAWLAARG